MEENFLHFIWQQQYFQKVGLKTTSDEKVNILSTGNHNLMSGPDFSEGRVEIDDLLWTGHVEIHIKSSDWDNHKHFKDPAYNNVILHVVWIADKEIFREDGTAPPTIELKERVEDSLLREYKNLVSNPRDILCFNKLNKVPEIIMIGMIERALVARLERKSEGILQMLEQNGKDWEETAYQLLAKGFGFKSNGDAFYELSKVLPLKIVYKHADDLMQLEAMLFGQAGLLTGRSKDNYHQQLQKEYEFLRHKHQLPDNMLKASIWKMGRLRPANFPTVRISQLAAALCSLKNVFSSFLYADSLQQLRFLLRRSPGDYWKNHFTFGEKTERKTSTLGLESADRLVINVVAPLLAAYSLSINNQTYMDQAITALQQLKPEKNAIIRRWNDLKISPSSSADTQGLIELYNSFCLNKSCLSCNIGTSILKTATV
jgi:hypothetical protein